MLDHLGPPGALAYIDDEMSSVIGNRRGCEAATGGQIQASGWCNQMRLGVDPFELGREIGHMHGGVDSLVTRARSFMKRHCPEQLGNDAVLRWMDDCGYPMKTDRCKD